MATCLESIDAAGSIEGLPVILPNTITPFSVTATSNKLFVLKSPQFQSVRFSFAISSPSWNTQVTVYSWDGGTAAVIGAVSIRNSVVSVSIDFPIGQYIICIRPGAAIAQVGTFVAAFTGYAQQATLELRMFGGENFYAPVEHNRPRKECTEALYFEILEGDLPPGLIMDMQGTITGLLPNLDCLEDAPAPAVNWFFTENDGTAWPWGRQWRFLVRVWVDGLKEIAFEDEWFCVKIHNNWTFDLDNFMEQSPFEHIQTIRVVDQPEPMKVECAPCKSMEKTQFVPQKIEQPCEPCANTTEANRVELIAIPVDLCDMEPSDYVAWYDANKGKSFDNPYIEKFIRDLEESQVFQIMVNHHETNPYESLEYAVATNYQNYLQLAEIRLDPTMDPENLAVLMRQWGTYMNQTLPTSGTGFGGEEFNVTLI